MIVNLLPFLATKLGAGILLGVLIVSHGFAFYRGHEWANAGIEEAVTKALTEQSKAHARALKNAVKDEKKINNTERTNEQLLAELEALASRTNCPMSDDELRVLQDIAGQTKRE